MFCRARPSPKVAVFITIIVKFPVIQIATMVLGFSITALEYPAPILKGTALHRSFGLRVVLLMVQAIVAALFYQVRFLHILHWQDSHEVPRP